MTKMTQNVINDPIGCLLKMGTQKRRIMQDVGLAVGSKLEEFLADTSSWGRLIEQVQGENASLYTGVELEAINGWVEGYVERVEESFTLNIAHADYVSFVRRHRRLPGRGEMWAQQ